MLKKFLVSLIVLGVVCFALLQTLGLSVAYILDAPAVATGIGSKLACSGKYISDYNENRIFDDIIEYSPVLQNLDLQYDDRQRQVTGTLFGLGKTTASYWPGLGCAIEYPGHTARDNIQAPENLPTHLAWPAGNRVDSIDDDAQRVLEKIVERDNRIGLDTRALLVVKDGRIVAETYAQGVGPDSMLLGWSMAKSLTGILIGHLVYTGRLALDAKGLFEPWTEDERKNIALTDMLTMTDGLDFSEVYEPGGDATAMLFMEPSAADYAMAKPLKHPPGQYFNYSSGTANMLARLFQQHTGGDLQSSLDYLVEHIVSLNWIQAAIATVFKPDSYSASNIGLPVRI